MLYLPAGKHIVARHMAAVIVAYQIQGLHYTGCDAVYISAFIQLNIVMGLLETVRVRRQISTGLLQTQEPNEVACR